jgi:hypothetical protein
VVVFADIRLASRGLMVAFEVYEESEDRVFACQAMADQLHDAIRVGAAIDIVTQRGRSEGS